MPCGVPGRRRRWIRCAASRTVLLTDHGYRKVDSKNETEADFLAGELLIPCQAALKAAFAGKTADGKPPAVHDAPATARSAASLFRPVGQQKSSDSRMARWSPHQPAGMPLTRLAASYGRGVPGDQAAWDGVHAVGGFAVDG
jgi:hypothetical protein